MRRLSRAYIGCLLHSFDLPALSPLRKTSHRRVAVSTVHYLFLGSICDSCKSTILCSTERRAFSVYAQTGCNFRVDVSPKCSMHRTTLDSLYKETTTTTTHARTHLLTVLKYYNPFLFTFPRRVRFLFSLSSQRLRFHVRSAGNDARRLLLREK